LEVDNHGCVPREKGIYCMDTSVVDYATANSHPYEEGIRRVKC